MCVCVKEGIETEATKRKQSHKLDGLVSTIAMNLEKKITQQAIGHYKTTSKWHLLCLKKKLYNKFFFHIYLIFKIGILIIMPIIDTCLLRLY